MLSYMITKCLQLSVPDRDSVLLKLGSSKIYEEWMKTLRELGYVRKKECEHRKARKAITMDREKRRVS